MIDLLYTNSDNRLTEIIVADGGSTDQTRRVAEKSGARVLHCGQRKRSHQLNSGAETAAGEILYFLHADSSPPPGFDKMIVQSVSSGYGAGCFRLKFDDSHPLLRFYGWCTRFDFDPFRFGDQTLFITRQLFMEIDGYRDDLIVMEDQEIIHRIRRKTDFRLLKKSVVTSARKYRKNGILRLQFIFGMIVLLYYGGARQETLVHLYHSCIRH